MSLINNVCKYKTLLKMYLIILIYKNKNYYKLIITMYDIKKNIFINNSIIL